MSANVLSIHVIFKVKYGPPFLTGKQGLLPRLRERRRRARQADAQWRLECPRQRQGESLIKLDTNFMAELDLCVPCVLSPDGSHCIDVGSNRRPSAHGEVSDRRGRRSECEEQCEHYFALLTCLQDSGVKCFEDTACKYRRDPAP